MYTSFKELSRDHAEMWQKLAEASDRQDTHIVHYDKRISIQTVLSALACSLIQLISAMESMPAENVCDALKDLVLTKRDKANAN